MTEQVQFYAEQLISSAKREAIAEAKEMLHNKITAILTLLDRGHAILQLSQGERFYKLYEQRAKLFSKALTYEDIITALHELSTKY